MEANKIKIVERQNQVTAAQPSDLALELSIPLIKFLTMTCPTPQDAYEVLLLAYSEIAVHGDKHPAEALLDAKLHLEQLFAYNEIEHSQCIQANCVEHAH